MENNSNNPIDPSREGNEKSDIKDFVEDINKSIDLIKQDMVILGVAVQSIVNVARKIF